jgi:hypothetical protein
VSQAGEIRRLLGVESLLNRPADDRLAGESPLAWRPVAEYLLQGCLPAAGQLSPGLVETVLNRQVAVIEHLTFL